MGFFHWLWYDFWQYDIYMFYFLCAVIGCYVVKWIFKGIRIKKGEENDNIKRNFWDYM